MSKFVVVNEIIDQLESAKSGLIAESVCQSVVSGINNVPSSLIQRNKSASGSCYTTFPLSPIIKNCCLDKTYLNLEFDANFKFTLKGLTSKKAYVIPLYIGFRDNASIFNQIQILIENSVIYDSTYHREESLVAYNSLPESEIRGNNQYSSLEKIEKGLYSPMKRIILKIDSTNTKTEVDITKTIHYKLTVDINRLNPLLSNLHFTTPHFGNLQLKVWMRNIQEAMFFCADYSYFSAVKAAADTVLSQPINNSYYQFYPLNLWLSKEIAANVIPFYAYNTTDKSMNLLSSLTIDNDSTQNFFTFEHGTAEIVQTNFDIREDEYRRLTEYFENLGSIIIPTQTFSSGTFNNASISSKTSLSTTQIATISGFNINFISIWYHPQEQATCFTNEFLKDIQLLIDGRTINSLPYNYVNDKCIVDCTQAIIDTDHEEINRDYLTSLSMFNTEDDDNYMTEAPSSYYGNGSIDTSINKLYLENPNSFMLNFSTNLPDAFHSGYCILENSNRAGILRFNAKSALDNTSSQLRNTETFPLIITHQTDLSQSITNGYTTFCDCCIVLNYDKNRGKCFDGQLSWASPFTE